MKNSRRTQHGAALIELALITPLLLLLTFITTEFGRAMYEYNAVVKSTRDAVRYLSVQTPGTHVTEARNLIVYGNIAGTGTPLARTRAQRGVKPSAAMFDSSTGTETASVVTTLNCPRRAAWA